MLGLQQHDQPSTDPAIGTESFSEFVGQLFGDEDNRIGLGRRVVEHRGQATFGGRVDRVRRTNVGT